MEAGCDRLEHTGVVVLRAWVDGGSPGGLRVRIIRVVGQTEPTAAAAATVDGAVALVRAWLEGLLESADPGSRPLR